MKRRLNTLFFGSVVAMAALMAGCGIDNTDDNTVGANLVSAEVIDDIDSATMLQVVQQSIDPTAQNAFGYKAVKITYTTKGINNEDVTASGLLVIPVASEAFKAYLASQGKTFSISSVCDNHGTIFLDAEAPTNVEIANGLPDYATAVAMTGYAGFASIIPDYVGYGVSKGATHPYILKDSAQASLDMIRASMRYMSDNGYLVNGQLYITGYSEGGYVAMALAKEIEENHSDEFKIQALAPMAGPYDVKALGDYELNPDKKMVYPAFLAYLADSYTKQYDIALDSVVQQPQVFQNVDLFGGDYNSVVIQTLLGLANPDAGDYGFNTHYANELFLDSFIQEYHANDQDPMKVAFEENSVAYWVPKTKVNLIHCVDDEIIPYVLSTKPTYEYMVSQGVDVIQTPIPTSYLQQQVDAQHPFVHANCGATAYGAALSWFNEIRNGASQ